MKIALVCPYDMAYPGGVIVHVTDMKERLKVLGHDVRIVAVSSKPVDDSEVIILAKSISIPAASTTTRISLSLNNRQKVLDLFAKEKFDVVHLHEPFMITLCPSVLNHGDAPMVATFHASGGFPGYWLGWPFTMHMMDKLSKRLLQKAAVSKTALSHVKNFVKDDFEIIPNGVNLLRFSPDGEKIEWMQDGMTNILFVGRLERRKGVVHLIKSFRSVKKAIPNARLVIAGPGVALKPRLKEMISRYHLKDVVFVGMVAAEDLPKYYRTADLFCAPATGRESFGIVLLEAMASGTPVVATSISGYRNVIIDGYSGVLARPKNQKDLGEKIIATLNDQDKMDMLIQNGLEHVKQYSWDVVADNVLNMYYKAIDKYREQKKSIKIDRTKH
ncbi:MAG: glycosyltransferase family 4 protein [Chloroflexi bacterium]|nr:glycosyltransferase family 4 protein [Chloroflexota bacterium]